MSFTKPHPHAVYHGQSKGPILGESCIIFHLYVQNHVPECDLQIKFNSNSFTLIK